MKHFLCLFITTFLSFGAMAQTSVNFMNDYAVVDQFRMVNSSDTALSPGAVGSNQLWNFSMLHQEDSITTHILSASAAPHASS